MVYFPLEALFYLLCRSTIPSLSELPLSACGCIDQIAYLFHTTHKVKTQQVTRNRGQRCGDIELPGYLASVSGPVPLVLDLCITHDRFGSSSDPSINGHLHYPNDLDGSLNEATTDKIRQYHTDYNNRSSNPTSFMTTITSTSGCSTSVAQTSPHSSSLRSATFSGRMKHCGLR